MNVITLNTEQAQHFADAKPGEPVVLVIEGEPAGICGIHFTPRDDCSMCQAFVPPVGWRVPAGEPVELRVGSVMNNRVGPEFGKVGKLVARATVELLPVVHCDQTFDGGNHVQVYPARHKQWPEDAYVWMVVKGTGEIGEGYKTTLDPLPVPGRHWVAICTPETT